MQFLIMGVVIAILVGYGIALYLKSKQAEIIGQLDEQKIAIFDIPVDSVILKLKNMHLTGQTKRLYESWASQWEQLVQSVLPDIEAELEYAEQFSDQLRLMKSRKSIDTARQLIADAEKSAFQIDEALQRIVDSETENHEEIEAISKQYKDLRNKVLTDEVKYNDAFKTLEKRLSSIEQLIEQFNTLMEEADYIEARDVLKDVEQQTIDTENKLGYIPDLFDLFDNGFSEQLADLKNGYQRMVDENYQFKDVDIEKSLQVLESDIAEGREDVVNLLLNSAQTRKDAISKEIDRLYTIMESEVSAKDTVKKIYPRIVEQAKQILESNRFVLLEIDRISQNYELIDNEENTIKGYKEELKKSIEALEHYGDVIDKNQVAYTTVQTQLNHISDTLKNIDTTQAELMKQLNGLRQRERDVREQLDMFELDLRNMKRTLEKQHLPGLSKTYLDLFFATTKQIETLSERLNRIKINMTEIDEFVAMCVEDVEQLDEATERIIDNALLTEQLIQYANRYRMDYDSIEKAINIAINLYQYQYKYTEAKDTISKALDIVESGASSRVIRLYEEDKRKRMI